jgi:WD40 repeat protein/uncharacterized caspase-like protein
MLRSILLLLFLNFSGLLLAQNATIVVQSGHYDEIMGMAFSPDGKVFASVGEDKKVILWDIQTGKQFQVLYGHKDGAQRAIFTPDGKTLITGGGRKDMSLIFWDWKNGKEIRKIEKAMSNSIEGFALSSDGKYLATGTYREMKMWNVATGEKVYEIIDPRKSYDMLPIKGDVDAIAFSSDNSLVALAVGNGTIQIRKALTGELQKEIVVKGTQVGVFAVAFAPDGKTVYASGSVGKLGQFDVKSGKPIMTIDNQGGGSPCPCMFTSDLNYFVNVCGGELTKLDIKAEKLVYDIEDVFYSIKGVTISPDGKLIAISGADKDDYYSIAIFNAATGAFLKYLSGFPGSVISLDFNDDNHMLASGTTLHPPRVWNLTSSAGFHNYEDGIYGSMGDIYATVRFSKDGEKLFQSRQNNMFTFHTESSKTAGAIRTGGRTRNAIEISPDGKYLAQTKGKVMIYDVATNEELHALAAPRTRLKSVAFGPKSDVLYAGGYTEIKRFKVNNGAFEELPKLPTKHYAEMISPHPDGKVIAVQQYSHTYILNAETGDINKQFEEKTEHPEYSPDGKLMVTNDKNVIHIWNVADYSLKYTLEGHSDQINAFEFTSDNKYMASASDDTSIKLWNLATGKLVATLIALKGEDYIIITPDNYYMTTQGGINGVAFRVDGKVFPFEQFDIQFNRPDIVLKRMGYADQKLIDAYHKAYEKRLKKMGFSEDMLGKDFHMPEVAITNIDDFGLETKNGEITLNIDAKDSKFNLDRVNIWINDVPIYGKNGMDIKSMNSKTYKKSIKLQLAHGMNKVQVSVTNQKAAEALKETFEINYTAPAGKPDLYVLALGASKFKDNRFDLTYAAKDADDIANKFKSSEGVFSEVHVKTVTNEQLTKGNITNLKSFFTSAKRDDIVMLFIAGHGILDSKYDYYYATTDLDFADPAKNGVVYEVIEGLLDGLQALKKLFIMDTCHSGEVDKDEVEIEEHAETEQGDVTFRHVGGDIKFKNSLGMESTSELMKELFTDLRRGTGATVISSAGGAEYAMEGDKWKNGLFTYCLLHGIETKEADLDNDGNIMISELQKYVKHEVKELSQGKQVPTSRIENVSLDFRVW